MNHQNIKDKLLSFRDPELSEEERGEIAAHLPLCEECRGVLSRWETAQTAFGSVSLEPSETFVGGVMNQLAALEEAQTRAGNRWALADWLLPVLGYGFAFALVFLAITHRESAVNAEAVLLADVPQTSSWAFSEETPEIDKLMDVSKEGV